MNKEVKAAALEVFEAYPTADVVHVTTDKQAFLAEDRARMHDKHYTTVKRADVIEEKSDATAPVKKSAEELIKTASECATVEELDALLEGETRKTVVAAIEERRKELTKGTE